jgi:arabinose-5-phosphate isomerase
MLALGDALALAVSRMRGFTRVDFAQAHPGGSLGRRLSKVEEYMRPVDQCRLARQSQSLREALIEQRKPGRRVGAVMVVDESGKLAGILTDSDFVRLLEAGREDALDGPVREVMTAEPLTVRAGAWMLDAVRIMKEHHISELPVIGPSDCPVGMIDITDLDCFVPAVHGDHEVQAARRPAAVPAPNLAIFREPKAKARRKGTC